MMSTTGSGDAELAARLVLLGLKGMGPARLRWICGRGDEAIGNIHGSAVEAIARLRAGKNPVDRANAPSGVTAEMVRSWQAGVRRTDGDERLEEHRRVGIAVLSPGHPDWPFAQDPEPPVLLFARGDLSVLQSRPIVGIVGTRRCTSIGRRVATQLGKELAAAGIVIASGLALGIDGAAHAGALHSASGAPVVGVVATGLDTVYPTKHEALWEQVADRGVLISEAPLGTSPQRWRFPARNRLLAGLVDLLIVVESHESGGALSTVDEAISRSVDVAVVPGSVLSSASVGSNALLMDGCVPICSALDALTYLGVNSASVNTENTNPGSMTSDSANSIGAAHLDRRAGGDGAFQLRLVTDEESSPPLGALEEKILVEISTGGTHIDALMRRTSASFPDIAQAIEALGVARLVLVDGSIVSLWSDLP